MMAVFAARFDAALWFWLATALLWWQVCAETLGTPNELLARARRDPGDAALFDRLARRNLAARAARWGRDGVAVGLAAGFLVAFSGVYALVGRSSAAAGAFCLLAPLAAHLLWTRRTALRLAAAEPDAETLLKRFLGLRAQARAAALLSVLLAVLLGGSVRLPTLP